MGRRRKRPAQQRKAPQHSPGRQPEVSAVPSALARKAPLRTPSDIDPQAVKEISGALNALLADVFSLYLKTKNFHWHMSGPLFRDDHLLLDDHADQIFVMTDDIAEHVRKIGGTTIRSIGEPPAHRTWPLPTGSRSGEV